MKFLDSRGKESTTLVFVFVAFMILTAKFAVAGLKIGDLGPAPGMGALEYGGACAAVLAIWLGREWTEKKN